MARYGKRVSHFSPTGPAPQIKINDNQFARLEAVYGVKLDADARAELLDIANKYLYWRVAEVHAERFDDVVARFEGVKAAVGAFQEFALEHLTGLSDAGVQLNGILDRHFRECLVPMLPGHIVDLKHDGSREPAQIPGQVMLVLDRELLSQVAESLSVAVIQAGKEIEAERAHTRGGFYPGSAFNRWLESMRDWAKRRGLRYGERGKDRQTAAPFATFLFELNKLFGTVTSHDTTEPLGQPVNSAEAMALRLKRMWACAKKVKARGGTK